MIGWIKRNLLVVVFLVLVVVSLPSAWFFSGRLNAGLRDRQQKDAEADLNALKRGSVSFELPAREPGAQPLTFQAPPNPEITKWFVEHGELLEADSEAVVTRSVSFNRREHSVLVDGLFPEPDSPTQGQFLAVNMVKLLVGDDGPSVYERMLAKAGAGAPVAPDTLGMMLADRAELEEQRLLAETGETQLSTEQKEQIQATLVSERLREYERKAREISFYGEASAITEPSTQNTGGYSLPPSTVPSQPPEIDECFIWQFDLWVVQDILDAIALTNTSPDGRSLGVEDAPVKRLLRLTINSLAGTAGGSGGTGGGGPPPFSGRGDPRNPDYGQPDPRFAPPSDPYGGAPDEEEPAAAPDGVAPLDLQRSITGRYSSKQNQLYDVRTVELDIVVASAKLPRLFDALARTNFMTVIDVDINEIDPWSDLRQGYYYGTDNVVRATLTIETLWLREWTVPLMPDGIATRLGVVKPEPNQDG